MVVRLRLGDRATVIPDGQTLGPYRVIERLGQGRQADVWRALRAVPPVEEVALKVLPAAAAAHDPRRRAQLRHEAERGTRFADPALLPTCDFGESEGLLFLAMPLVVGCALGELLEHRRAFLAGRPLPRDVHPLATVPEPHYTRAIAMLVARIARAVSAAHAARVVHRDIKPMNILVRRDLAIDGDGAVRFSDASEPGAFLCDFGLARDLDVATPWQLRDGAGSPLYMAPERLLKRPADEFRCDVYALGVTLFEALTLESPVDVPPELPSSEWAAYLAAVEPRRASVLRPDLSERLEDVVHRAMAHDPAHRHPTATHFADDLEQAAWLSRV
jgi:serine/threonine protein kinase